MTAVVLIIGVGIGLGLVGRHYGAGHQAILVVAALALAVYEFFGGAA